TSPGQTREVVQIDDLRIEEIARQCGKAFVIRRQETPALAGKKLHVAAAEVSPEQTNARHERTVGGGEVVTAAGAVEIDLVVADEVGALEIAIEAEAD